MKKLCKTVFKFALFIAMDANFGVAKVLAQPYNAGTQI